MAASANNVQGVFGRFVPVIDETVTPSADNVQGIFGRFDAVLDDAAGGAPPATLLPRLSLLGVG